MMIIVMIEYHYQQQQHYQSSINLHNKIYQCISAAVNFLSTELITMAIIIVPEAEDKVNKKFIRCEMKIPSCRAATAFCRASGSQNTRGK